jgi:serine phosphatase RsbU (regulator of sigma subunit)/anti-sigma regulatory factor (Ser/Thr protein kinase)
VGSGHSRTFHIAANLSAASTARREVAATLRPGWIAEDVLADVVLLVSELVTNVVRHETSRIIDLEVALDGCDAVTVTVTGSRGEKATALGGPLVLASPSNEAGRGLIIVDSLASAWGTRRSNGRTSVWFTLPCGKSSTEPDPTALIGPSMDVATSTAADPAMTAMRAAATAKQAAVDAAKRTADAAKDAQVARAASAIAAAAAVAEAAARTVRAVQTQAEELASAVASAAHDAAVTVSNSVVVGGDLEAAGVAQRIAATVLAAALAKAEQTTEAAVLVARAVAAAADSVATTTAAAAAAVEIEVAQAADAVRAVTSATAQELAADTVERAAAVALVSHEAALASRALHEANRLLLQAGVHDRRVALALQEAMLTHLPETEKVLLASRYLTAAGEDQVGGDWYDAIVLPGGGTTLVIGDVIGHDIHAAAVMGQLRNLLRAQILERNHPPSDVVARLDRANRDLRIDTLATLVVLNVEPPEPDDRDHVAVLRWSNAGHPAPVLVHANGRAVQLDTATDLLLGVEPDRPRRDHTCRVPWGATVLLYTDGLVETRSASIDAGLHRLLAAVSTHHRLEPAAMLDAVLADMVGTQPGDDVAVLAARFQNTLDSGLGAVRAGPSLSIRGPRREPLRPLTQPDTLRQSRPA